MSNTTNNTAVITAQIDPCICGAKRWFMCKCPGEVIDYTFYLEPDHSRVSTAQIAHIRALHPKADLIYID